MKKLTLLGIGLALAMQASAQIANPWQQQFALTPSPNQTPSYVFYIGAPASSCVLAWNYSAAETHSNLSFTVYTSPSLSIPHTNWIAVTNFSSLSNSITTGSNLQFTVRVPVWHGAQFWTATADDSFWGKSFFAQDAWTNPLPRIDQKITITR